MLIRRLVCTCCCHLPVGPRCSDTAYVPQMEWAMTTRSLGAQATHNVRYRLFYRVTRVVNLFCNYNNNCVTRHNYTFGHAL